MNWQSAAEFWAMGGYGLFVWSSFGLCLAVFALELVSVQQRNKRAKHPSGDEPGAAPHPPSGNPGGPTVPIKPKSGTPDPSAAGVSLEPAFNNNPFDQLNQGGEASAQ